MIRWPLAKSLGPIGLDLGTHSFHAVQLRRAGTAWQTAATLSLPRVNPGPIVTADEIRRLCGVLERRGFVGREVVLAIPAAGLLSAMLELPARAPGVPVETIAAAEFGRVHRLDPAAVSMTMWDLPAPARASRATFAMAVGTKADTLRTHVDVVESCGLRVTAVDEPLSAVARGALGDSGSIGQTAVVDFGHHALRLAIVHGRTLAYTRTLLDAGTSAVLHAAAEATKSDLADVEQSLWHPSAADVTSADTVPADTTLIDLLNGHLEVVLREITQAFAYAARQYPDLPVAAVRLAGGGALLPGVAEKFAEALAVACTACGDAATPAPLTLARGLALFGEAA